MTEIEKNSISVIILLQNNYLCVSFVVIRVLTAEFWLTM